MNTSLIDAERQASARIEVLMQKADAPLDDLNAFSTATAKSAWPHSSSTICTR